MVFTPFFLFMVPEHMIFEYNPTRDVLLVYLLWWYSDDNNTADNFYYRQLLWVSPLSEGSANTTQYNCAVGPNGYVKYHITTKSTVWTPAGGTLLPLSSTTFPVCIFTTTQVKVKVPKNYKN